MKGGGEIAAELSGPKMPRPTTKATRHIRRCLWILKLQNLMDSFLLITISRHVCVWGGQQEEILDNLVIFNVPFSVI